MRKTIIAAAAAALMVAVASPAFAGGWAVTSFENLPERFEAGTTYTLDYTVLAHGRTPVDAGASNVTFQYSDKSKPLTFQATNHGDGTYTVEVTLPREGAWSWEVASGFGAQDLGTIEVSAPEAPAAGFGLDDALKVILPLATLAAAIFTVREWTARRGEAAPASTR